MTSTRVTNSLCAAFVALCTFLVWGASAQTFLDFSKTAPFDPARVAAVSVYVVDAPLTAIGGTGHVFSDTSLTNGTEDVTLSAGTEPDSLRELVIFQSENTGTALTVTYAIQVVNWDGTFTTHTLTLNSTESFALPEPVLGVNRLFITIAGSAVSDVIKIGYRGFAFPGTYPTAATDLIYEGINGVAVGTAGTIPQPGIVLPNSIAATNTYRLVIRTRNTTQKYFLQGRAGSFNTPINWGTNP